ncbi:hypothetical protein DMENIID0001_025260 [Sergentomyia squamirostris]
MNGEDPIPSGRYSMVIVDALMNAREARRQSDLCVYGEIISDTTYLEEKIRQKNKITRVLRDCMKLEMQFTRLLTKIAATKSLPDTSGVASDTPFGANPITRLVEMMALQIRDQRQQRILEGGRFENILRSQRKGNGQTRPFTGRNS